VCAIGFDAQMFLKGVEKRTVMRIEIPLIGTVNGFAWVERRGKEIQVLAHMFDRGSIWRVVKFAEFVSAVTMGGDDDKWTTTTVRKLGDMFGSGIAVRLDKDSDHVADEEKDGRASGVGEFGVIRPSVFDKQPENFCSEDGLGLAMTEEFVEIRDWIGGGLESSGVVERKIERKSEGPADGGDTANDVGAVDGAGIPGIGSAMGRFDGDTNGTSGFASDGDGLV
jgi:hypothetical protein